MKTRHLFVALAIPLALGVANAATLSQENVHYKKHTAPLSVVSTANKTVVVEFFSYGCNHCANFNPVFQEWAKRNPNVEVQKIPVGFHAQWVPLQKLYYTLSIMGLEDKYGPRVFVAIHQAKQALYTDEAVIKWATGNGLDVAKFTSIYNSMGVAAKVSRATSLVKQQKIPGVPFVSVAGKYYVDNQSVQSADHFVSIIDDILKNIGAGK